MKTSTLKYFHCRGVISIWKMGGPKAVAMLVTLCWDDIITQTTRWEVVKICASPKRPFFFLEFHIIFPIFRAFPVQIGKSMLKITPPCPPRFYFIVLSDFTPYLTDMKQPINTTSDGTFLSVVCENPPKSVVGQKLGGLWPPQPPQELPPCIVLLRVPLKQLVE